VALDEHHWLGRRLVGETMRYVALGPDNEWLAVLGFGAAALACKPRDRFIGWDDELHFARLRYVTNNQRFCVLPAGRRTNLASNVLAKTLKRLSGDFEARWGHPVVMVETFVDPDGPSSGYLLHRWRVHVAGPHARLRTLRWELSPSRTAEVDVRTSAAS
jgi:GNAT superfamily N-acetyltransferase